MAVKASQAADPRVVPFALSASNSAAMLKASGFNSVIQCNVALTSSIRAIYAYTIQKGDSWRPYSWDLTLTRSTLVNSPLSRPVSKDSVVASIKRGNGLAAMLKFSS